MRVGRAALDQEAIRLIEECHPQIHFDWPQILNGEEEAAPPPEAGRREPEPRAAMAGAPADLAPVDAAPQEPPPVNPAHARLGSEGLARLRARYSEVVATIGRRVQDEARRKPILDQAERLNPDGWVTDEEVGRGLEEYEAVLASLRDVVGRRRRRKRSRPGNPAGGPQSSTAAGTPPDDEDGPGEPDEPPEGE